MKAESRPHATPDLEVDAETFARLVYARLDPPRIAPVRHDDPLDQLRKAFPGR